MRLSESIRKNILEIGSDGIYNRFKISTRRTTLFFEELGSVYIKKAESSGYARETERMGYLWMRLFFDNMIPSVLRRIPATTLLNNIVKKVWVNVGTMDDLLINREKQNIHILSVNEGLTRFIGKNSLMQGFYRGVLESLLRKPVELLDSSNNGNETRYHFRIATGKPEKIYSKDKMIYNRLNTIQKTSDVNMKTLLRKRIFRLAENRIYFRGKMIINIENTLFHLVGNSGLLEESIPKLSRDFFRDLVDKKSGTLKNLLLMKYLLQAMGWGRISVIESMDGLTLQIRNPPYGLQTEKDNWNFLGGVFLGYLNCLGKDYKINRQITGYKQLRIEYSL